MNEGCFLCESTPAPMVLNIPCAPGGRLNVCAKCYHEPDLDTKVFAKYRTSHVKRITMFKTKVKGDN